MTKLYRMGDSSAPPAAPTQLPVYAFYAGGETPHAWTDGEVAALDARWGLPIWVAVSAGANPHRDADQYAARLYDLAWTARTCVALDTEDKEMAAYVLAFDYAMKGAGFPLIHYESEAAERGNPPTSGGRWAADWNGHAVLPPGDVAAQYQPAQPGGLPWDSSVISSAVNLHELNPVASAPRHYESAGCLMPVLKTGSRGYAAGLLQAMLVRALPAAAGPDMEDGVFGPVTEKWTAYWQMLYGVASPTGVCDASTWESLLTRS